MLTCRGPFSISLKIAKRMQTVQIVQKLSKNANKFLKMLKNSQKCSKLGFATRCFAVALLLLELSRCWSLSEAVVCCGMLWDAVGCCWMLLEAVGGCRSLSEFVGGCQMLCDAVVGG